MGWDIGRFADEVDEEFKCSICLNVLEQPVNGPCGHVFCSSCINTWLDQSQRNATQISGPRRRIIFSGTCPVDRKALCREELVDAAIPFRNMLSRLKMKCDFEQYGCNTITPLGSIRDHVRSCTWNPDEVIPCPNGCSSLFVRKDLINSPHNCIKELKKIIRRQEKKIHQMELHQVQQRRRWIRIYMTVSLAAVAVVLFYSSTFDRILRHVINNL